MDLQAIKREYEENGYYIFRNVLDTDFVAELDEHVKWLLKKFDVKSPEHLHHPLMRDDAFWVSAVADQRLLDIAKIFVGPKLVSFTSHYVCKPAQTGVPVYWHQDGAYWNLDPMTAVALWVAVDKSNEDNGCLYMIPGSHKQPLYPLKKDHSKDNMLASTLSGEHFDIKDAVPVILEPGDVSVHHPNLIHGSFENRSPTRRCGLDIGYTSADVAYRDTNLYLSPFLLCDIDKVDGEVYSPWPLYDKNNGLSMPFKHSEQWNERANAINTHHNFKSDTDNESVMSITNRMIDRLNATNTSKDMSVIAAEKKTQG